MIYYKITITVPWRREERKVISMKKILSLVVIIIGFLLVTFFGLGPVLMADGSRIERLLTFVVVLLLYLLLGFAFKYIKKL